MFNYAKTLDHVGFFANNIIDTLIITSAVTNNFGRSDSFNAKEVEYFENEFKKVPNKIKVGYLKEIFESHTSEEYTKIQDFIEILKNDRNFEIVELTLPEIYNSREIYSVKTAVEGFKEFTSATDDYSIFGERINYKIKQGKELLAEKEVILRIDEYEKVLVSKYNNLFNFVDLIITPLTSFHKDINIVTVQNFTKTPAVALPLALGTNGVPVGLQVCGKLNTDKELLLKAKYIEDLIGFKHKPKCIIL